VGKISKQSREVHLDNDLVFPDYVFDDLVEFHAH